MRYKLLIAIIALGISLISCGSRINTTNPNPGTIILPDLNADFSNQNMVQAFNSLQASISKEYPFTQWKNINWNGLYQQYLPQVEAAMANNNQLLYYTTIRQYLFNIPDGHVAIENNSYDNTMYNQTFGGSYGIELASTNTNQVIIARVANSSLAATLQVGEIVTQWNSIPILQALSNLDITWRPLANSIATTNYSNLLKLDLLTRGAVGSIANITVTPQSGGSQTVQLTAIADNVNTIASPLLYVHSDTDYPISTKLINNGAAKYEYVNLGVIYPLAPNPNLPYPNGGQETFNKLQQAIVEANSQNTNGLIMDLRGNIGGSDLAAANLLGFFFNTQVFYEYITYYFPNAGKQLLVTYPNGTPFSILTNPNQPYYNGCIVTIVNPSTISSGEGLAYFISQAPHGNAVGFYGTNGRVNASKLLAPYISQY